MGGWEGWLMGWVGGCWVGGLMGWVGGLVSCLVSS